MTVDPLLGLATVAFFIAVFALLRLQAENAALREELDELRERFSADAGQRVSSAEVPQSAAGAE